KNRSVASSLPPEQKRRAHRIGARRFSCGGLPLDHCAQLFERSVPSKLSQVREGLRLGISTASSPLHDPSRGEPSQTATGSSSPSTRIVSVPPSFTVLKSSPKTRSFQGCVQTSAWGFEPGSRR